jgi:hypothetical protein
MQALRGIAAQFTGLLAAFLITRMLHWNGMWPLLAIQAAGAALFSVQFGQPRWWLAIHLFFLPAAIGLLALNIPPPVYLVIFAGMALVFWGTAKGDVPLFLSSTDVATALDSIVAREQAGLFAELGAGIGSVAIPLGQRRPQVCIDAWEKAPLPWMILAWRARNQSNLAVLRNNFWEANLNRYDLVFAFLSPPAMPALKDKARRQMRPGTLLVSSSFPVPEWKPEEVRTLEDGRHTILYCYRI